MILVAVVKSSTLAGDIVATEWSQWRGPKRDGISPETGLLKSWPRGGPALVWRVTDLGGGYSTPSFSKGKIFGMSYRGSDEVVWALDANTGREVWATRIAQAARVDYGQGSRSTPTVDGGLVYALGVSGDVACLDAATGVERWHRNLEKDFGGHRPGWGYSESILVDGDKVVCTPGGSNGAVVAINKANGELIWQSKEFTDGPAYASLVITNIDGVRQYVQMTHASIAGIAADSGTLLWRYARNGPTAAVPTPIVSGDLVYATSGYGAGCHMIKLVGRDRTITPQEVYANDVMTNHHGGVVLVGDHLYGFSDSKGWVCQNLKSGELVWNDRGKLGKGAITYADGLLYLRSERGTVALIEATPNGYAEKGRFEQPDRSSHQAWPHPVITGGRLYLRDQDVLLCYDVKGDRSPVTSDGSRPHTEAQNSQRQDGKVLSSR
jgi:outer membrane protein assembly factor BamB